MNRKKSRYSIRELAVSAVLYIILIAFLIFFLYPIFWDVELSLEPQVNIFVLPPHYIFVPTLEHFVKVFTGWQFTAYAVNSIVISGSAVVASLLLGVPCAYVISRYDIPSKANIASIVLSFRFLPVVAIAIPLYLLYVRIGFFDTDWGLAILYVLFNMPFVVWLMKGFIDGLPTAVEDAAQVDGNSRFEVFYKFTIPLVSRGLAATTLFCLILTWNDFGAALILTGHSARTLPAQSLQFVSSFALDWGGLAAAAIVIALPMMIFGILIRNYLIKGLTFGAVH